MPKENGAKQMTFKIVISQRQDIILDRDEVRDSLDVNWYPTLHNLLQTEYLLFPIMNNPEFVEDFLAEINPDLVIISGGNSCEIRGKTESKIIEFTRKYLIPLFGVCHGMQFINEYFGGGFHEIDNHVKTTHHLVDINSKKLINFQVNSYHTIAIKQESLAPVLTPLLADMNGNIEACINNDKRIFCIMWHPERNREHKEMQEKWIRYYLNLILRK